MCIRDRYKAQEEREKIDPLTQKPVIGADGKAVTETIEVLRLSLIHISRTRFSRKSVSLMKRPARAKPAFILRMS